MASEQVSADAGKAKGAKINEQTITGSILMGGNPALGRNSNIILAGASE
jgi:hypothetical protein